MKVGVIWNGFIPSCLTRCVELQGVTSHLAAGTRHRSWGTSLQVQLHIEELCSVFQADGDIYIVYTLRPIFSENGQTSFICRGKMQQKKKTLKPFFVLKHEKRFFFLRSDVGLKVTGGGRGAAGGEESSILLRHPNLPTSSLAQSFSLSGSEKRFLIINF